MDMPSNLNRTVLLFFLSLICQQAFTQKNPLIKAIWQLEEHGIERIDTDSRGNIFFSTPNGHLRQYNDSGDSINFYAPNFSAGISRLDAHWTVSVFLFYESQQRFEILDRFLSPLSSKSMADLGLTGFFSQATPGNNHSIWLYDETDLSLKKINYNNRNLVQEQPLNILFPESSLQILQLIERKNLLFVQVSNEAVYILDNQANFIKAIPIASKIPIFIESESIFYLENNKVLKNNFITGELAAAEIPDTYEFTGLAVTNKTLVLTHPQGLIAFARPENF